MKPSDALLLLERDSSSPPAMPGWCDYCGCEVDGKVLGEHDDEACPIGVMDRAGQTAIDKLLFVEALVKRGEA